MILPTQLDAQRLLLTNSFKAFVKWAWKYVTPFKLVWGRHLDALCEHLQAIRDGRITNLLVNLPPRHSKSIVCTILWPVWMWLSDPSEAVLSASFAMDLATEHSGKSRRLVEHEDFRRLFPWVQLEDGSNAQDRFKTTAGGGRKAVSVGAGTTGFDATILCIDDLHSIKKKESDQERHNALEYFRNDLMSRGVLGRKVRTVVIGQRVHGNDVSGLVIDQFRDNPDWSYLILPLEYDPDREVLRNSLGWKDWRTERGQILFPETVTPAMVAGFKATARHSYQCLYNQDVLSATGEIFKAEWIVRYRLENGVYTLGNRTVREAACSRIAMVDLAVSTSSTADYTAIVVADVIGADMILRHVERGRWDGTSLVPKIRAIHSTYRPAFVGVENVAMQRAIIDQLRQSGLPIRAIRPDGHKEQRSYTLQARMEARTVWFPPGADTVWLEHELLSFPRGRNDDGLDCLSYLAQMAGRYAAREEIPDEVREKQAEELQAKWRASMLMAGIE